MAWKIAIDAMGGDKGPRPLIEGALLAAAESGSHIILVGDEHLLTAEMKESTNGGLPFEIRHAPQVITMEESPVTAFRKKKAASIRVAMEMVRAREADAVISAGHTGATLLAATLILKTLPGLDRPAIATLLPTMRGHAVLIDAGGECRLQAHPPLPVWHHGQRLRHARAPTRPAAGRHVEHRRRGQQGQ